MGKGAMGVVYDGELARLEQRVAIKVLRPEILGEPDLVARFDREARLVAKMKSEHVVRVLDVDVTADGLPFLVMEKLDGHDLGLEIRRRGPLPIGEALEYVRQICAGMTEAHRAGIIHRDLKPSNIFLVRRESSPDPHERQVKILDFGVSKIVGDANLTATESTLGTPRYMSPEQIRSAKSVDERTDVWSIAVILFELLTGKTPFAGESATGMAAAIVVDPPLYVRALRPEVPEALERVVMAGLAKNPAERIPSVAALREALDAFASPGRASLAGGASPAPFAPPPSSPALADPASRGHAPLAAASLGGHAPIGAPVQLSPDRDPSQGAHGLGGAAIRVPESGVPPSTSIPPGPTQASWAHAPTAAAGQALPMRTIVTLFVVLFVGTAAVLTVGLVLTRKPPMAASTPVATASAAEPSSAARSVSEPPRGDDPATTATATSLPAASSPAASSPAGSAASPAVPVPSVDVASPTGAPPTATSPHPVASIAAASHTPAPVPSAAKPAPVKDCPASEKILVGSKLVCP